MFPEVSVSPACGMAPCTPLREDHMTSCDCHMTRLTDNREGKDEDQVDVQVLPVSKVTLILEGRMMSL